MTVTARARHEPAETEDPRNGMLDLVEHAIEQAKALGLEAPLRERLKRLLPDPERAPAPVALPSGDLWEASVIFTALAEARRKIKSPASVKQIETALGFARRRFEDLKASKGPAA